MTHPTVGTPFETLLLRLDLEGNAVDWARSEPRSVGVAWATCPRGDWLIEIAARLELDRRTILRAASDCVAVALPLVAAEAVGQNGWTLVRRYLDGQAGIAECWVVGASARDIAAACAEHEPRTAEALLAVAHLAFACDEKAHPSYWARQGNAAEAVRRTVTAVGNGMSRQCADIVRSHLPYEKVTKNIALILRSATRSGIVAAEVGVARDPSERFVTVRGRKS